MSIDHDLFDTDAAPAPGKEARSATIERPVPAPATAPTSATTPSPSARRGARAERGDGSDYTAEHI